MQGEHSHPQCRFALTAARSSLPQFCDGPFHRKQFPSTSNGCIFINCIHGLLYYCKMHIIKHSTKNKNTNTSSLLPLGVNPVLRCPLRGWGSPGGRSVERGGYKSDPGEALGGGGGGIRAAGEVESTGGIREGGSRPGGSRARESGAEGSRAGRSPVRGLRPQRVSEARVWQQPRQVLHQVPLLLDLLQQRSEQLVNSRASAHKPGVGRSNLPAPSHSRPRPGLPPARGHAPSRVPQ